jgi:hypothetical protein
VAVMLLFLAEFAWALCFWWALFPLVMVATTPFVLMAAALSGEPYRQGVVRRYPRVHRWWNEWGIMVVPP